MTTSIGQAAKIVGISETQLRYWEEKSDALLSPTRSRSEAGGTIRRGQRLYSVNDLRRLILIKELLAQSFSLTTIAQFMQGADQLFGNDAGLASSEAQEQDLSIFDRIRRAEHALFWRFFVPRAVYLSACLLFEGQPSGDTGLFLPIRMPETTLEPLEIVAPQELSALGKTLLGWRQRDYPFYTFVYNYGITPSSPERYRLIVLDELAPGNLVTNAYIVTEHRFASLTRKTRPAALRTAQRLLSLLQMRASAWCPFLEKGTDYMVYHSPSFTNPTLGDPSLTGIAEEVVNLGGLRAGSAEPRWRFACFLVPKDPSAPLHQRSLIVRAQSEKSPHKTGITTTLLAGPQTSLTQRAYQSGHIIYRSNITSEDKAIASRDVEGPIRSAIAVPIAGADGQPAAVLYVASDDPHAFSEEDQLLLRTIERMAGELIVTYDARSLFTENLKEVVEKPGIVDVFFKEFASENDFMSKLETLLASVAIAEQPFFEALSFIAIDLDNHTTINDQYGDWASRDLVRAVGQRIQGQTRALSKKPEDIHLYRIFGDRFYLMLQGISRQKAIELAEELRRSLKLPYQVNVSRSSNEQPIPPSTMLNLKTVTARLGVTSYHFQTLKSLLEQDTEVSNVRAKMTSALDEALDLGKGQEGDKVIAWDPQAGLVPWPQL
ncbi:MAG TPA: MerR family transcriptional regulator [Ktedonobacterales bacterium]